MERINQLLVTGVPGCELDAQTASLFRKLQPGGYILFGRNIQSPQQLRKLIDDLRDLSAHEPFIMIDEEGGRVSRLKLLGNESPGAQQYREHGDLERVKRHGTLTGQLMRLFGMNVNLGPVVEVALDDDADNALRGRCFGTTPEQVISFARAYNQALRAQGILSCGKHFPGYAGVKVDPHHEFGLTHRTRKQLEQVELLPYRKLSAELDAVMTSHTWYASIDPEALPATLSHNLIQKLLREDIGYGGLVITDDLDMGALLNRYSLEECVRLAVEAGNDQVLICHRIDALPLAATALNRISTSAVDRALAHIETARTRLSPPRQFSDTAYNALDAAVWDLRVDTLGHERAKERSSDKSKRSPVEKY